MCGCERHQDTTAPCTCLCNEHRNFEFARDLAMSRYDEIARLQEQLDETEAATAPPTGAPEQNIGEVARGLQQIHDDMVARIGDVYVNLASWTSPTGKLLTLSYGTVSPDDEDGDDDA